MILFDVNVLVYALRSDTPRHEAYADWLENTLNQSAAFLILDEVLRSVLRLVTNRRVFNTPTDWSIASAFITVFRDHPLARKPSAGGDAYWAVFEKLCQTLKMKGDDLPDAWIAAIALVEGATLITTDRGFARFPGLMWQHPLDHAVPVVNPQ